MTPKELVKYFDMIRDLTGYTTNHELLERIRYYLEPASASLIQSFGSNTSDQERTHDQNVSNYDLLNTDAEYCMEDIAQFTFNNIFTKDGPWFYLRGGANLAQKQFLEAATTQIHRRLRRSNFYPVMRKAVKDTLVYGLSAVSCHKEDNMYEYKNEGFGRFVIEEDNLRRIKALYTESSISLEEAKHLYNYESKETNISPYEKVSVKIYVVPNRSPYVESPGARRFKYALRKIICDPKNDVTETELPIKYFESNPYLIGRCLLARRHPYGNGLGQKILPLAAQLNMYLAQIDNHGWKVRNPSYTAPNNNNTTNTDANSVYGKITYLEPGQENMFGIHQYAGDITPTTELYNQARQTLREMILKPDIDIEKQKKINSVDRISNFVSRVNFISPYLDRFMKEVIEPILVHKELSYLLRDSDFTLKDMPDLEVIMTSPLFNIEAHEKIMNMGQVAELANILTTNDPSAAIAVDTEKNLRTLYEAINLASNTRSEEEVDQIRQSIAEQQAAQQAPEQAKMNSETELNEAKASELNNEPQ